MDPSRYARSWGLQALTRPIFRHPSQNHHDAVLGATQFEVAAMADKAALAEIDRKIQIVEDNLRELIEQAAAYSGAADEERNADRIAAQQAKLDTLLKEREALLGKG